MSHQQHNTSNFWFGFALGTFGAVTAAYLLGTKKGRDQLKKCIELAEKVEEESPDLMQGIHEMLKGIQDTGVLDAISQSQDEKSQNFSSIDTVMDKIKNVGNQKKYVKKFFQKDS